MRSVFFAALLAAAMSQTNTSQALAQNADRAQGTQEGVQVHGDWVIEIRNADGTMAHRHAFKNALVGGPLLAAIMGRGVVPGNWQVALFGDACGTQCQLSENLGNLTLALSPAGTEIVLTGTVTATNPSATSVGLVITRLSVCAAAAVASKDCVPIVTEAFSSQTLPSLIPMAFNQMAVVTVTFSFS